MAQLKISVDSPIILVDAELVGRITIHARLVVDTGASLVILPWWMAVGLGLSIDPKRLVSASTASAVESAPFTTIPQVSVLGLSVKRVPCMIKDLPAQSGVDGLLGLSYLRHFKITLDMQSGLLTLI